MSSWLASTNVPGRHAAPAAKIGAIAARQHGVVSRAQLLAAGISSATMSDWVRTGHLYRLHRSVYAVGNPNVGQRGAWMAAVLACGSGAALSHASGAVNLGIGKQSRGAIHISVPRRRNPSPAAIVVHRPRGLEPDRDVRLHANIPTTTATRTLFDEARRISARELRDLFYSAESLRVLDRRRLQTLLDAAQARRGFDVLRELLAEGTIPLAEVRSCLERIIAELCAEFGLPLPAVNVPVLEYEVDFLWPKARFIVEADGAHHRGPQRDRDNERDLALARAGYLVRRYSSRPLADRRAVAIEIRDVLGERLPGGGRAEFPAVLPEGREAAPAGTGKV